MVQQKFRLAPFSGTLFLPCGYRQDWIKRLYWEEDGFALVTKRLEAGSFQWPRN
uniref:IS66 family insertion sequence element accessory protein TnpB n=2 Tax=Eubacteriales TaxID=186802 RepID=UPI003FF0CAE9